MSKTSDVSAQLGEPDQVATAAIRGYRQRTFFGRHPSAKFWVFGVLPGVSMLVTFVLSCLGLMAFADLFKTSLGDFRGSIGPMVLGYGVSFLTVVLPALLLAILFCVIVKRFGIGRRWMLISCIMLALIAMLPFHSFVLSSVPGGSQWNIGLRLPPSFPQGVRFLMPIVVGLWFMWRTNATTDLSGKAIGRQ